MMLHVCRPFSLSTTGNSSNWHYRFLCGALCLVHAALLAWSSTRLSPTLDEIGHLPAGISHWQFCDFDLYRVNPPLPRMVAAIPVLWCRPKTDWSNYQLNPLARETIPMGIRFAKANGMRTFFLFAVGRWACIPFSLLGAWVCWRWGTELWGNKAGIAALILWCCNPLILGHGALIMPDVPAAATGALAAFKFWEWLREPCWSRSVVAGLALGMAEVCKTTLLILFLVWPAAWLLKRTLHSGKRTCEPGQVGQLSIIILTSILIMNMIYGFDGSFSKLQDYTFSSVRVRRIMSLIGT